MSPIVIIVYQERQDQPLSCAITNLGGLVAVAVCRDHKLRVWNLQSLDCVMASDLVALTAETGRNLGPGAQGHKLRVVSGEGKEVVVALHLCFHQHSQFLLVRLAITSGQIGLSPVSTVYCPDYDLVDFSVHERQITAVWTTGEGDTIVRRTVPGGQVRHDFEPPNS